jgi:hypothetical protein
MGLLSQFSSLALESEACYLYRTDMGREPKNRAGPETLSRDLAAHNRVAEGIQPSAITTPCMRVRTGRCPKTLKVSRPITSFLPQ